MHKSEDIQWDVSLVIPVLNEKDSISILYDEISEVMKKEDLSYEIIFIDDGSSDGSYQIMEEMSNTYDNISVIRFRRNFGKAVALQHGFDYASGKIVFTLDADLQDDPKEIPRFIEKLDEGYDLVSGWKQKRHDPLNKTLPSKLFNKTISSLSGVHIHDFNCGFKAYRNEVVKSINVYGEMHRYIPVLAHSEGFKVSEIVVNHRAREYGKSKYGIKRYTRGLFDCITVVFLGKYSKRPLHFFGKFSLILGALGTLVCLYLVALKISGQMISHRPLLNLGILLIILGTQFLCTGLVAEMMVANKNSKGDSYISQIINNKKA